MMHTLAPWLLALVAASIKGSLILLAVLLAVRGMRRSSAEARHAIVAIGLVAFLVLPVATLLAPVWAVIPLPAAPADLAAAIDRVRGDNRSIGESAGNSGRTNGAADARGPGESEGGTRDLRIVPEGGGGRAVQPVHGATPTADVPDGVERQAAAAAPAREDAMSRDFSLPAPSQAEALLLAWLFGASLIGLRLLLGVARLRLLSTRATMVTDGAWLHAAHAIARRLGLSRGVTLLRGDREAVPMTWGVLRPVVWLPPAADAWPTDVRTSVLSHELAHVRRRDAVTQWIANIAVALHWFNPLVWIATRALRAERERACDDAVITLGAAPDDYAAHLLDMVRALGTRGGPAPAMAMARRSQFEGRLLAILDRACSRAPVGGARLVAAGMAAALLVLILGGLRSGEAARVPDPRAGLMRLEVSTSVIARREPPPVGQNDAGTRLNPAPSTASTTAASPAPRADSMHADMTTPPPSRLGIGADDDRMPPVEPGPVTPAPSAPPAPMPARVPLQATTVSRTDTTLLLEVIAAAEGISSSSDRVAVLERVANLPELSPTVVTALGRAAGRITSSSSRTKLLRTLVRKQPHAVGVSRRAVLDALSQTATSSDVSVVLEDFIRRDSITEAALADALTAAERMTSSTEKARVLVAAARHRKPEGAARAAYLKTAATITTGSERARALSALFEDPPRDGGAAK